MKNNSFRFDSSVPHLNAVVGKDLLVSKEYGYMLGFGQAVETMLAAAVSESYVDPYTGEPKAIYIDALVYPLCFCARHFIELFLKRQISAVSALKTGVPASVKAIHDLMDLWKELKTYLAVDVRLQELGMPLEEFIKDFADIDVSGETFRYGQDTNGKIHLQSVSHINLQVLGERLKKMMKLAESFDLSIEPLQREYAQKTTTDGLSREQIRKIALRLPPYETWKDGTLDSVKQEIRTDLGITSNAFGRAIDIIKKHRSFGALIGIEIPLPGLTQDVFTRLKDIADGHESTATISNDEWVRLEAVLEIGRLDAFSEEYDPFVEYFSSEMRAYPLDCDHLRRSIFARNQRFKVGLRKLGQKTLLSAFNILFPEEPASSRETEDDLRELFQRHLK